MFFILSKLIYFLAMPIGWVLSLLLITLFIRKKTLKKMCLKLVISILLVSSNPLITNFTMLQWEVAPSSLKKVKVYDVGILLTGVILSNKSPKDRIYFLKGADRITHTAKLYKLGKIKKIIVTGASDIAWSGQVANTQTHLAVQMLIELGVPKASIIWEQQSRNTYENALFTSKILKNRFPNQSYLLITSGFHMRRARACFIKQNIKADTFSTDFYTTDLRISPRTLIPSAYAFWRFSTMIKELLGFFVYKTMGYL